MKPLFKKLWWFSFRYTTLKELDVRGTCFKLLVEWIYRCTHFRVWATLILSRQCCCLPTLNESSHLRNWHEAVNRTTFYNQTYICQSKLNSAFVLKCFIFPQLRFKCPQCLQESITANKKLTFIGNLAQLINERSLFIFFLWNKALT